MNSYTAFVYDKYAPKKEWKCITMEYPRLKDFVADLKGNGYAIRHAVLTENYDEACEKWHLKNKVQKELRKEDKERKARAKIKFEKEEAHRKAKIEAGEITKEELDSNFCKALEIYGNEGRSQEYKDRMDAYDRGEKYQEREVKQEENPDLCSASEEGVAELAKMTRIEIDPLLGTLRLVITVNPDANDGIQIETYSPHWQMSLDRAIAGTKVYGFCDTLEIMNRSKTGGKVCLEDNVGAETAFARIANETRSVIFFEDPPLEASPKEMAEMYERNSVKLEKARKGEHLIIEGKPPWGDMPWRKIKLDGYEGTWGVIDVMYANYDTLSGWCFLLESERYGDEAACIVIDQNKAVLLDSAWNGWDDLEYKYDE